MHNYVWVYITLCAVCLLIFLILSCREILIVYNILTLNFLIIHEFYNNMISVTFGYCNRGLCRPSKLIFSHNNNIAEPSKAMHRQII